MKHFDLYLKKKLLDKYQIKYLFDIYEPSIINEVTVLDSNCYDYRYSKLADYKTYMSSRCYFYKNIYFWTATQPYYYFIDRFMLQIGYIDINLIFEYLEENYFRKNFYYLREIYYINNWLHKNSIRINIKDYIEINYTKINLDKLYISIINALELENLYNYLEFLRMYYFPSELKKLSKKYKFKTTDKHYSLIRRIDTEITYAIQDKTITNKDQILDYFTQTFFIKFLPYIKGVYNEKLKSAKN